MPQNDQDQNLEDIPSFNSEGSTEVDEVEISFREVLKNKDFVKILLGQIGSNSGDAILRVALLLYIYSLTGSITITTIVLAAQVVPWIIIGPIVGVLADRISRKGIMIAADLLRAICILLIPLTPNISYLVVLSFLIGVASTSFASPRSAAVPEITGMKLYVKAISLSQMIFQSISVIGPLIGALFYASLGKSTFYFTGVLFMISAAFIFITIIPSAERSDEELSLKLVMTDLKRGFQYLLTEETIKKIIILFTILIFGGVFAGTLIYPYLYEVIYNGVESKESTAQKEYGIVGAIIALGSIFGYLVFGKFEKQIGRPNAIFVGSIGLGIYYFTFLLIPTLKLLIVFGLIFGFANGMTSLAVNAIFAETVPNEIRGRAYSATNSYIQVFTIVSILLSGIIADTFGIVETIVGAGIFLFLAVFIFTYNTRYYKFLKPSMNPIL